MIPQLSSGLHAVVVRNKREVEAGGASFLVVAQRWACPPTVNVFDSKDSTELVRIYAIGSIRDAALA